MSIVLDVSNHDLSTFDAECLRKSGVERIIVNCWDYGATETILLRARSAGIIVEDLYCYLYFGLGWEQREVENALAIVRKHGGIKRIWADVEADPRNESAGQTPASRAAATRTAVAAITGAGIHPGIYTYGPYWLNQMGNTREFAGLPLWYANYGKNDPDKPLGPVRTVDFGGWGNVAIHQYSSNIVCCGRQRDHNYWFIEEDDEVTREEYDNLKSWVMEVRAALTGCGFRDPKAVSDEEIIKQSVVLQNWNENGNSLLAGYVAEQQLRAEQGVLIAQLARQVADGDTTNTSAVADALEKVAAELRAGKDSNSASATS